MRILKRVLLSILFLITLIIVGVSGVIIWALNDPQGAWKVVENQLLPHDLKITWDRMGFSGERFGGLDFRVNWEVEGLRIQKRSPSVELPIGLLRAQFSFDYANRLFTIHELRVRAPAPLRFVPGPSDPSAKPQNVYQQLQSYLGYLDLFKKYALLKTVAIDVDRFELGQPVTLSIRARARKEADQDELNVFADVGIGGASAVGLATAAALNLQKLGASEPFLDARVSFNGYGVTTTQELAVTHSGEETSLSTRGPIIYSAKKIRMRVTPVLALRMNALEAVTELKADVLGIPGPLVRTRGIEARMTTPLENDVLWSDKPSAFSIAAPIELFFIDRNMRPPLEKSCKCRIPESIQAVAEGQLWLASLLNKRAGKHPLVDVAVSIESVRNKLLSVDFSGKLRIEKDAEAYLFSPEVNLAATIHSYQGVRRFLDAKNVLIPAPLDVLEGALTFTANGPVALGAEEYELPSTLAVNLRSKNQLVNATSENKLRLSRDLKRIFVDVRAKIADLQLEVPPLDPMRGNPRVVPDRRVLAEPKRKPAGGSSVGFAFAVSVETTRPGAIRLLSPYFEPNLPISVRLASRTMHPLSGEVRLEPFNISYLRRTMRVERLILDLDKAPTGVIPVDGRFRIDQAQYKIYIEVRGPVQKPAIEMSSDPYLPQNEIISVLLYGRTSDALVSADAETAGSVQAAVEDRAIGLFGLWAFAATPIKSFSYNPVTKVYMATVALSDDTTAGVGTNWEQTTNLELRKRITGKWMLTAAWVPGAQGEPDKTQLVFQWENRY